MPTQTTSKFHYAWVILFCTCLMGFTIMCFMVTPFSLYVKPITTEFGWSRSAYTLTQSFQFLAAVIFSFLFGTLTKKYGSKALIITGAVILTICMFLYSSASTLPVFYVSGLLTGIAFALATVSAGSTLINNWFAKNTGLMIGILFTVTSLGGVVFNPLIASWIAQYGWRTAFRISGIIVAIVGVILLLLLKNKPADKNMLPMYADSAENVEFKKEATPARELPGVMLKDAIKSYRIWIFFAIIFMSGAIIPTTVATVPAYLGDLGFPVVFWGVVNSVIMATNTIIKIPAGWITDKLGVIVMLAMALGAFAASLVCLIFSSQAAPQFVYAAAFFFGFAVLMTSVPMPIMVREFFGIKDFANIMGMMFAALTIGQAIATPLINLVFDIAGSYRNIYIAFIPVAILIFVLSVIGTRKKKAASSPEAQTQSV